MFKKILAILFCAVVAAIFGAYFFFVSRLEAKQVLEMVAQMPEDLRVIFNLRLVEEFSFKEIAEELDKNENTVRVYYQRARQWLINRIND